MLRLKGDMRGGVLLPMNWDTILAYFMRINFFHEAKDQIVTMGYP